MRHPSNEVMQLSDEAVANLFALARMLLPAFREAFPDAGAAERIEEGCLWITVPAHAAEVGALEVMVDDTEATIHLGEHTHTHISPWSCGDEGADPHVAVTEATITYVRDVLADRVVIWSHYVDGRQVSGGAYHRGLSDGTWRPPEAAAYLWSGARHLPTSPSDA